MTIYVNNSGTWSLAKEVYVNDGGTWKEPQEIYINDGGTWKLAHKVIYITSSALNINLASLAGNPTSPIRLKVVINPGVSIYSSTPATAALTVGSFPSGSQILLTNNGNIYGAGGIGGKGADYNGSAVTGGGGGTAVQTGFPITINNLGTIAAGGGGGGGAGYYVYYTGYKGYYASHSVAGSGGGGGAGNVAGTGGLGGAGAEYNGGQGATATLTTGGGGGTATNTYTGGSGGGQGQPGTAGTGGSNNAGGGTSGYYIVGNANVTWTTVGTVIGQVG